MKEERQEMEVPYLEKKQVCIKDVQHTKVMKENHKVHTLRSGSLLRTSKMNGIEAQIT